MTVEAAWSVSLRQFERYRKYRNQSLWGNFVALSGVAYISKILVEVLVLTLLGTLARPTIMLTINLVFASIPAFYVIHAYQVKKRGASLENLP